MVAVDDISSLRIGVLGGTGPQGRGLAFRFARARLSVRLGSRDAGRAADTAATLMDKLPADAATLTGDANEEVARSSDLVIAAIPWDGHSDLLTSLRDQLVGKIVVDCVNPIGFDKRGPHAVSVDEGSAAEQAAAILPESRVVAAFHHVSAVLLEDPDVSNVDCDVLVLGDDRDATDAVEALANVVPGMRGVYAGRLRNAGQVEALTANLIAINRRYKAHAGIRITDI